MTGSEEIESKLNVLIQLEKKQIDSLKSIAKLIGTDFKTLATEIINVYLQFKEQQTTKDIED